MLLFAKEEDILNAKRAFEKMTGIDGALALFNLYNLLRLEMIFDFKLSLEFKFLLGFHLMSDPQFGLEIGLPPIPPLKARYGYAIYNTDAYDPPPPPPKYEPIRIEVFRGPDAWIEKIAYMLTYKYTMHDRYYYNQPLSEAERRSHAYAEYLTRSPEYIATGKDLHYVSRAAEFIYIAACWFDLNSFDIGRFWPGKVPLRVPRDDQDPLLPRFDRSRFDGSHFDYNLSDLPYFDLDMFGSARFDTMLRPDVIIWIEDPYMTATRFNLAAFDNARFDVVPIGPDRVVTALSNYLQAANIGDKLQTEVEDYRLRSDPLVAGMIWIVTSDRFGPNWVQHGVRMLWTGARASSILDDETLLGRIGYQAFTRELRTRDITLGKASREQVIAKYIKMGLDERILRRLSTMVEYL